MTFPRMAALEWLFSAVLGYVFLLLVIGLLLCIRGLPRCFRAADPNITTRPAAQKENGPP
jgi:hypothetical protein